MVGTAREQQVVSAVPTGLLLGGQWRPAATGATFSVETSNGPDHRRGGRRHHADALQALDAASKAQPGMTVPVSAARSSAGPMTS